MSPLNLAYLSVDGMFLGEVVQKSVGLLSDVDRRLAFLIKLRELEGFY